MIGVARVMAVAAALAAAIALAGCSDGSVEPDPVQPSVAPTTGHTASAAPLKYDRYGTALSNKAYFDATNKALVAKKSMPGGEAVIDNLVKAGFNVKAMQVSPDKTSIGLDAEAIYFSVKIDGQCLIGQIGASFGYHSIVAPPISTGACLIGLTRTIDWNPTA